VFAKRSAEIIPEEATSVWSCTNENCSGWMRDNFSFMNIPTCPLCHSEMTIGEKMLPCLHNNNKKGIL